MRLLSGLWLFALVLFNPLAVEARYVSGEPPNQCAACGCVVCATHPSSLPPAAARRRTQKATSGTATAAVRQLPNSVWSGLDITIFGRRWLASRHA